MSIKGVTFDIKYDDTYSDRYDALHKVFKRFNVIENKTTSCVFLETSSSVDAVHAALYGALDWRRDKAIVFETYRHTMQTLGPM